MVEQGDEGEMGVLEGQGDEVVGLEKGKEDTPVWGGFLGSERPSGVSGACPGAVLLVSPVPGACPLKILHRISIGPGVGVRRWKEVIGVSSRGRIGRSGDAGVPTSSFPVLIWLCRAGSRLRFGSGGGWKGVTKFFQFFSWTSSSRLLRAFSGSPQSPKCTVCVPLSLIPSHLTFFSLERLGTRLQ